jgi:hypothetical protein
LQLWHTDCRVHHHQATQAWAEAARTPYNKERRNRCMDDLFLLHEVALAGGLAVEGGAVAGVLAAGRNGKLGPAGAAPPALQAHERY